MTEDTIPEDWRARPCPYPGRAELEDAMLAAELEVLALTGAAP